MKNKRLKRLILIIKTRCKSQPSAKLNFSFAGLALVTMPGHFFIFSKYVCANMFLICSGCWIQTSPTKVRYKWLNKFKMEYFVFIFATDNQ